jgi:hypothetical protein
MLSLGPTFRVVFQQLQCPGPRIAADPVGPAPWFWLAGGGDDVTCELPVDEVPEPPDPLLVNEPLLPEEVPALPPPALSVVCAETACCEDDDGAGA